METNVGAHPAAIVSVTIHIKIKTIFAKAFMRLTFQWCFSLLRP